MNKLDRTLSQEIKKANGDGSREAKFALLNKIHAAAKDMSTTAIRTQFDDLLRKHGRAVISAKIYEIYQQFIAPEDIHVYSMNIIHYVI